MKGITKIRQTINCCYLMKLLEKVNKELAESKLEAEIIQLIYCSLEKEGKLCQKCN